MAKETLHRLLPSLYSPVLSLRAPSLASKGLETTAFK
jgi:hypothetical protein